MVFELFFLLLGLGAYLTWDYLVGFFVTKALRWMFKRYLAMPSYRWQIEWISVSPGFREVTIEIGPFRWLNPKKFPETPYFLEIRRVSIRVAPLSVVGFLRRGSPIEVAHVEVQGVTVHLENHAKYGLNLWACLGTTEAKFQEQVEIVEETAEPQKADEPQKKTDKPEAQKAEKASKHWGLKSLGKFDIRRVSFRNLNVHNAGAYLATSNTRGVDPHPINLVLVEMPRRELKSKRGGLFIDEVVMRSVWKIVDAIVKSSKVTLVRSFAAISSKEALKNAGKGAMNAALNASQNTTVKVNARLLDLPRDLNLPKELVIRVMEAKHLTTPTDNKPSCYLKFQIGKKGVKAKTTVQSSTKNPTWQEKIVLAPVESLSLDLRIQVYAKNLFADDEQLGATLKIPLDSLTRGVDRVSWIRVPATPDEDLIINDDDDQVNPTIHIALLLQ